MQLSRKEQQTTTTGPASPQSNSHGADQSEDGVTIGGVFCGKPIGEGLMLEELTERRFVVRQLIEPTYARRVGEVCGGECFGGGKTYQATKPNGEHVAMARSIKSAAKKLKQPMPNVIAARMPSKPLSFEGLKSEIAHHNSTGGGAQQWAVADQQKSVAMGNLITGGPLDAPL